MRSNLRTARQNVAALRQALLSPSPEEIDRCLPGLAEAATCLSMIEAGLRTEAPDPELASELKTLKLDLKMIGRMIQHSAAFYRGWASLLGAASGSGYSSNGRAAEIAGSSTISVQG
jgi:hypothetical protein